MKNFIYNVFQILNRMLKMKKAEPFALDYMPEVAREKVKAICEIAMMRENAVKTMLDLYVYRSIKNYTVTK